MGLELRNLNIKQMLETRQKEDVYSELKMRLAFESAIVVFKKGNGDVRFMLCTRNTTTADLCCMDNASTFKLNRKDKSCTMELNSLAVIDLERAETRSFKVNRLIDVFLIGKIYNDADLNTAIVEFSKFKQDKQYYYGGETDGRFQ